VSAGAARRPDPKPPGEQLQNGKRRRERPEPPGARSGLATRERIAAHTEERTRSRSWLLGDLINLLYSPLVATTLKLSFQPDADDLECQNLSQQPLSQSQDIGIVVGAGQSG
jgi:hypothetical protein